MIFGRNKPPHASLTEAQIAQRASRRRAALHAKDQHAATVKMAGEALEALPDREWIDTIIVSLAGRIDTVDLVWLEELGNHIGHEAHMAGRRRAVGKP